MSTPELKPSQSALVEIRRGEESQEFALQGPAATIGRAADNDIVLNDAFASRHHARFEWTNGNLAIVDLGSGNGTLVNADRLKPNMPRPLGDGDRVQIGDYTLVLRLPELAIERTMLEQAAIPAESAQTMAAAAPQKLSLAGREHLTVGRAAENDIALDYPSVSRRHAEILLKDGKYWIRDFASTNGTFVNGERVPVESPHVLNPGDMIRIGPVKFLVAPQALEQVNEAGNLRLDALHLTQPPAQRRGVLNDISLSILPREFVAIVGVSGAGKSTLLNALSGYRPVNQGAVLVNGVDLYHNFQAYRNEIGFVPQQDIIHKELTVREALDYSARLRLPADMTADERRKRVTEVLQTLDLSERKNVPIGSLSGGQLKRVSIGVELLTEPSLFYLDEATSGLDPGTENQLMHLLRKLADQGHTILLVTHATKNVTLCDQVVFLAKGGNLAYFGPPQEALGHFGVQEFDQVYSKLESERTPEEWAQLYRQSPQHRKYIVGRLQEQYGPLPTAPAAAAAKQKKRRSKPGTTGRRVSSIRQFLILSQRNLNILLRDRVSLILMILVAPLIAGLNALNWKQGVFAAQGGDARQALTDLYLVALNGVFIGSVSSMREIVKEADIYRRERLVTLRIGPYVLSKVWVGVLFSFYQALVFLGFARLASGWPDTLESAAQVFFTLWLLIIASMFLGLLISAISANQNVTPLLLITVLIPEIVFAGGLLPIKTFGPAGEVIAPLTVTKWSYEALVTISNLGKDVANDVCWLLPKDQRDALTDEQKTTQCTCMGPNLFHKCQFPGVLDNYVAAVDQPEPVQPQKPGDPPPPPTPPAQPTDKSADAQQKYQAQLLTFQTSLGQYQADLTAYQAKVKQFEADTDTWRTQYQDWKERREKAIGQSEALIDKVNADTGSAFNVNLPFNWGMLGLISAVVFGLIMIVQKRKDNV